MSKSIGRVFGTGSMSPYGYETDYMQYLQGYNPYNYEQTLQNMMPSAVNVNVQPDCQLSVQNSTSQSEETTDSFSEKPEEADARLRRMLNKIIDNVNQMNAYKESLYQTYNWYDRNTNAYDVPQTATNDYTVNTENLLGKPSSYFQNNNSTSNWSGNSGDFGGNLYNGFNQNTNFGANLNNSKTHVLQNQPPTQWNNLAVQITTEPRYDNYLTEAQRIKALRNGENLRLHIDENPQENGDWKRWCDLDQGSIAVNKYNDVVDKYANQYSIDPDLVKAIMFAENACGYYYGANKLADYLGFSKSQLPMNIRGNIWSDFQGKHYDTNVPEQNIELGTRLIKQIYDSIEDPTPEKVTTIWNSAAKDKISSFGYRGGTAYRTKPWLSNKGK